MVKSVGVLACYMGGSGEAEPPQGHVVKCVRVLVSCMGGSGGATAVTVTVHIYTYVYHLWAAVVLPNVQLEAIVFFSLRHNVAGSRRRYFSHI